MIRLRPQFFTDFHEILHAVQKCGRFIAYCLSDKPEVVCGFQTCADSDFGSFEALCVCEQIGSQTITSTILCRFSRNFACCSEMWSLHRLLFVRQTGSCLLISEVCGFRFRQFWGSADHIFQQISIKSHTQIKLINVYFVFNGEWNRI